jgi:hypothetical protein
VVPALGDPDLSGARSLAELIAFGDMDALAGFRDAHVGKVRAFCEIACPSAQVDAACEATFVEFVARVKADPSDDRALEALLLRATRSAAAGRFLVEQPAASADVTDELAAHVDPAICHAMPELVAAHQNGELRDDPEDLQRDQRRCVTCTATVARMQEAEQAFTAAPGPGTDC